MKSIFDYILKNKSLINKLIIYLISIFFLLYLFPKQNKFKYDIIKGSSWKYESIYAPFDFAILKSAKEIEKEKELLANESIVYYDFSEEIYNNVIEQYSEKFNLFFLFPLSSNEFQEVFDLGIRLIDNIYANGVLPIDFNEKKEISIIRNNSEIQVNIDEIFNIKDLSDFLNENLKFTDLENYKNSFFNLLFEIVSPNLIKNENFTLQSLNESLSSLSMTRDIVIEGSLIISKGELIEGEKYQKLLSLKNEYSSEVFNDNNFYWILFGYLLLIIISISLLFTFLNKYYNSIYQNNRELSFVLFNIVLMIFLSTRILNFNPNYIYAVPICILPLIIKAFFDSRLGLFAHFVTILLLGFLVPNSFEFIFLQFLVGLVTVLSVSELYKRANLFISVFQIVFVYIICYTAFHITREGNLSGFSFLTIGLFIINGLATLFVQPLIYLYEKIFKLVSDVSLLELSDTNSKLLRQLSDKAPGSFHHSLQVANLAEASAIEIKANVLLTRVGALYHDIGKMNNPAYFSENQISKASPHKKITPKESAKIIIDHVNDGVQIAKRYNLPKRVINFIKTHHGTSKVYFFYKKEELKNGFANENDFSYNGPKPFSKETAILMMADSVEAGSKSIKNPTIDILKTFVNQIIDNQMFEKQFTNADITLAEIEKVKKVLINKLININHLRVEYPK